MQFECGCRLWDRRTIIGSIGEQARCDIEHDVSCEALFAHGLDVPVPHHLQHDKEQHLVSQMCMANPFREERSELRMRVWEQGT